MDNGLVELCTESMDELLRRQALVADAFDDGITGAPLYTYTWKEKLHFKFCGIIKGVIIKLDNVFLDGEFQEQDGY